MSQKKKTTAQSKRPRKAPSNQTGGTAWGKKAAAAISGKMQSADMKKLILLNFPYIIAFYMVEKAAWLYRHCNGDTIVDRLMVLFMNFGLAYKSYLPSVHPFDLLVGLIGAAALKAVIYFKGKNAKKYRQGEEYGSARWGNAKDIEPFIDPVFENNVLLTQTERLMMSGRPKHPKYIIGTNYLTGTLQIAIVTFTVFIRKIFPCAMLGGILVSTTRVNEFMAAMNRIHMPKAMVIPMTVMLRYFPMVHEDWGYIRDAMRMRDVAPTVKSLLTHPARTVECIYVPMMMSALKVADELSAAAVTRGLENPKPRTCLQEIHFSIADAVCFLLFTLFMSVSVWLKLKGGAG